MSIVEQFVDKYYVERRNTNSLKWDALEERFGDKDLLALWVADMEFKTPDILNFLKVTIMNIKNGIKKTLIFQ